MKLFRQSQIAFSVLVAFTSGCSMFAADKPATFATMAELPAFDQSKFQGQAQVDRQRLATLYEQILALEPGQQTRQQIRYRLSQMQTEQLTNSELAPETERAELEKLAQQYETLLADYPTDLNNELIRYQLARSYDLLGKTELSLAQLNALLSAYPDSDFAAEVWFRKADIHYSRAEYEQALAAYQQVLSRKSPKLKQHAHYMAGWCEFKTGNYANADQMFLQALDLTEPLYQNTLKTEQASNNAQQQRLRAELLQILSVSLSYQQQSTSLQQLLDKTPYRDGRVSSRPIAQVSALYQALADFLAGKQLETASLDTYRTFIQAYPQEPEAPQFQLKLIKRLLDTAQAELALAEQRQFVRLFGPGSDYWRFGREHQLDEIQPALLQYLNYFASNAYRQAQQQKSIELFSAAADDYQLMVTVLQRKADVAYNTADLRYLSAEALAQAGQTTKAIQAYDELAYGAAPQPAATLYQPQDAAYKAILLAEKSSVTAVDLQAMQQRFFRQFPEHPNAMQVALAQLQQLQQQQSFDPALALADQMLHWPVTLTSDAAVQWQRQALFIQSQMQLQQQQYGAAEQSLNQLLGFGQVPGVDQAMLKTQLASAIYQQAQQPEASKASQQQLLEKLLQQPESQYHEAASWQQIELAEGAQAQLLMQQFLKRYPQSERRLSVQAKLVAELEKSGDHAAMATLYSQMAQESKDPQVQREALWNAATESGKAGLAQQALTQWQRYVERFPQPHDAAQEARFAQVTLLKANPNLTIVTADAPTKKGKKAAKTAPSGLNALLDRIVQAEQVAYGNTNERTKFISAQASLQLGSYLSNEFKQVQLTNPLKVSLKRKRDLMSQAIHHFELAIKAGVATVTTQANYEVAELYRLLAKDLLASERPKGLDELALEQYNLLLEEQAYPFEEQAIAIYQKNLELMQLDVFDDYIRQSLRRLAELVPAKYQRTEVFPEVIDGAN